MLKVRAQSGLEYTFWCHGQEGNLSSPGVLFKSDHHANLFVPLVSVLSCHITLTPLVSSTEKIIIMQNETQNRTSWKSTICVERRLLIENDFYKRNLQTDSDQLPSKWCLVVSRFSSHWLTSTSPTTVFTSCHLLWSHLAAAGMPPTRRKKW